MEPSERDVRALLAGLDAGPLPGFDVDAVMREGRRYQRRQATYRSVASLAAVLVVVGVVAGVARLSGASSPGPATSPTPTSSHASPAPSGPATPSVRVVSTTPVSPPGSVSELAVAGPVLWAVQASGAGQPGHLLRATTADPRLSAVAPVGTYVSGLAATSTRVWVASPGSDPRDHAALPDTVQEFDAAGHLLRTYPLPGAAAVTADGDTAWVLGGQGQGAKVYRLSSGSVRPLATLGTAIVAPPGRNALQLTGAGGLAVVANGAAGADVPARLWLLDSETGATRSRVDLPFPGWTSVAVQGARLLVAGSGEGGGVVAVEGEKVIPLGGCPTGRGLAIAASAQQAWLLDTEAGGTWLVGAGCTPGVPTAPEGSLDGAATVAVQGKDAWVLAGADLTHLTVVGSPACTAADLAAKQTRNGAVMSQPFSVITLTNTSGQACTLRGYPSVVQVSTTAGSNASLAAGSLVVADDSLYEVPDPGPGSVALAPGGHAWFAVGTATAYDGPLLTISHLRFSPTGSSAAGVTVAVSLNGNAPAGKPLTVTVTAFAPGSGP